MHKAEARAPSGCCPPPDDDEVPVGTRQRECSDQVIARDFLGKAGQPGIVTLIVLGRKGPHGFPFRRPHSQFPIH